MIYNDLLNHIKTVDQARELSSEIDTLLDSLFKTQKGLEEGLNAISNSHAQMLNDALSALPALQGEALQARGRQTNNLSMIKQYLEGLKVEVQKLKSIKLTLAFDPSQKSIDTIFAWVSQNLGSGLVLDINTDKTILGGAIIEYEGRYEDYSLRKRLEEVFGTKREEGISLQKTQNTQ